MPIVSYVRLRDFELYYKNESAMREAGFARYADFVRAVFSAIDAHGRAPK